MATGRLRASVAAPDGPVPAARGLGPWLGRIAPARARGEVSLAVISDARMRTLNRIYRGTDEATDVLSFAPWNQERAARTRALGSTRRQPRAADARLPTPVSRFLGEIVIAKGVAARQARQARHTLRTELRILALHGLLHLLGYDHEVDDGEMVRLESRLRRHAGLPADITGRAPGAAPSRSGPARARRPARSR